MAMICSRTRVVTSLLGLTFVLCGFLESVHAQLPAVSLAELRSVSAVFNNTEFFLSPNFGDPHPITGVVTPGEYWINGDHIADPTNSNPYFLILGGTGNTFDFTGTTIYLDTRKLDGFGRNLGHGSGVDVVRLEGTDNLVRNLTLIGQDIALDTDPNAQRYADWATQYFVLSGDDNMVDGAYVVTRGSRTDAYGLGDAFGKGASQGITPFLGHRKASAFRVGEATNAFVNNMHLEVNTFGHGFFVQSSTNTTLTNSTVTGELFSTQGVIDHPLYQQFGVTYHQNEIPLKMISGAEGGVRMYTGSSGLTVDSVVVTNMRNGFASSLGGGTKTFNNVEAYGTEGSFDLGNDTTITNAKADGINGPIINVDRDIRRNASIEVELVGDQPFFHNEALIHINGNDMDVTITSNRPAEDFVGTALFRSAQFYYSNWRETNGTTTYDVPGYDHTNSVLINDTNMLLLLGEQAEGNVGRSQGGVISNGKENFYDGVTYVPAGDWLEVVHTQGLGNSGVQAGAEFDGNFNVSFNGVVTADTLDENSTVVELGGTLELANGIRIANEKLTISGDGSAGQGALYVAGTGSRFGSSSNGDASTIFLDGDAAIGVESDLIVGRIQGVGNLTKLGPGKLSLEKSNTFTGDMIVADGEVSVRSNGVRYGLTVEAGASIEPLGDDGYNTTEPASVDGTLDLNGRGNEATLIQRIGSLGGNGQVVCSNAAPGAAAILEILGDVVDDVFNGTITGEISLIKSGTGFQSLTGNMSHTGPTSVSEGGLLIDGTHLGGGDYTVTGGILGGDGSVDSDVTVSNGGGIAPGGVLQDIVGTFGVGRNYSQDSQSVLWLDLESVSSSDQLMVFGAASLAGSLDLTSTDPSAYSIGDTMTLVNSISGVIGQFDLVDGVSVGPVQGLSSGLAVQYDTTGVFARVTIVGDTNFDNQVDVLMDAFTLIANLGMTSGATWADGDFNGDGVVDVLGDAFGLIGNLGIVL